MSNDAAGFASARDRSVAPPNGGFDAGLRPGPFPDRAASLLPSLLAATRTGLTPAGDDELMLDQLLTQHLQRWAHERSGLVGAIVKCCGSRPDKNQAATFSSVVVVWSSVMRMPSSNCASASTSATSSWPLKRRQRSWAASSSL